MKTELFFHSNFLMRINTSGLNYLNRHLQDNTNFKPAFNNSNGVGDFPNIVQATTM